MPLTSSRPELFRDLPSSFNAHPVTGKVGVVTNDAAVKQAVKNLVLSNFYERPYSPAKGGNIVAQLFENMTPITGHAFSKNIRRVLENYEPRADVQDVRIEPDTDRNGVNITIIFFILNDPTPIEVEFFLERVR